jgi:hypothetical protein
MIPKADWNANRATYLQRAQLEDFADCKATLKALDKALMPVKRKPTRTW